MLKTLRLLGCLLFLLPVFLETGAQAEVLDSADNGFTCRHLVTIAAPPDQVYQTLVNEIGRWWHPDHTYTGDAGNLYLEPIPGGKFGERLDGEDGEDGVEGGVLHLEVVYAEPGKILRLRGGLGPLQGMGVDGALTWSLAEADSGTELTVTYVVGGYHPQGLKSLAAPVDGVISQQADRLKQHVEQ